MILSSRVKKIITIVSEEGIAGTSEREEDTKIILGI
jgi:hypothetical protein